MIKNNNMYKLNLFFSWQSDTKDNHKKISNSLQDACNTIRKEGLYDICYHESTWYTSGSPVIEEEVVKKAQNCDLFVADLTPIGTSGKKYLPNPNVMYELGAAKGNLTDKSTLLLYTGKINASRMPFDVNHRRLSAFSKKTITNYIRMMAEYAVSNPRHHSLFDEPDKQQFLYSTLNIQKNISSGKYLPNVFLENRKIKQYLRDFVAPYPFAKLVLERCDMIDTYCINRKRKIQSKVPFEFDIECYKNIVAYENIGHFYKDVKRLEKYVFEKSSELSNQDAMSYIKASKLNSYISHLQCVSSKLLLITASAGQGKTNLICDLVQNVLLKRRIPFVYINGYEIDANDIFKTFADIMLPGTNLAFDEVINNTVTYCKYKRTPIVLIVDGLNENPKPDVFSNNLLIFVTKVLQYDYVKVLLTCRSEYYDEFFMDFDTVFEDHMVKIEDVNKNYNDDDQQRLIQNYLTYFNINAVFTENVKKSLCKDLLMLRIFCEANKNRSLGNVFSIKKDDVFAEYYETMRNKLVKTVYNEEHYKLDTNHIDSLVMNMVKYMVDNRAVFNVPLFYLKKQLIDKEKEIFNRFLNENILLRKVSPSA